MAAQAATGLAPLASTRYRDTAVSTASTRDPRSNTPRFSPAHMSALMDAMILAQAMPKKTQTPAPTVRKNGPGYGIAARRPNCTHMTMKRVHGNFKCNMCGTSPEVAWVYQCTQDEELDQIMPAPMVNSIDLPIITAKDDFYTTTAQVAESYHMHSCIVNGIRERHYSPDQILKLLMQKGNVFFTIRSTRSSQAEAAAKSHHQSPDTLASSEKTPSTKEYHHGDDNKETPVFATDTPVKSAATQNTSLPKSCKWQVCHSCRPFYADRGLMGFETVMSGVRTAITEEEVPQLSMYDPSIAKTIGLRGRPLPRIPQHATSFDRMEHFNPSGTSDNDDTSELCPDSTAVMDYELESMPASLVDPRPRSDDTYSPDFEDGLRALKCSFRPNPDFVRMTPEPSTNSLRPTLGRTAETPASISSTDSTISLPTPRTPAIIITPIEAAQGRQSFEESLHHKLDRIGKAASISGTRLTTIDEGRSDWNVRNGKAASISGSTISGKISDDVFGHPLRTQPSSSTVGSEVSVRGGVALTEEAVINACPDVVDEAKEYRYSLI